MWIRFGKSIWRGCSDSARGSIIKTLRSWFTSSYSVLLSRPSLHQPCHFQSCSNCSRIFHFPPLSVVSASGSAQTQGLVLVYSQYQYQANFNSILHQGGHLLFQSSILSSNPSVNPSSKAIAGISIVFARRHTTQSRIQDTHAMHAVYS